VLASRPAPDVAASYQLSLLYIALRFTASRGLAGKICQRILLFNWICLLNHLNQNDNLQEEHLPLLVGRRFEVRVSTSYLPL